MAKAIKTAFGIIEYKAEKLAHSQPKIVESYMDDDGSKMYILDNGNTCKADVYDRIWSVPKGEINWNTKGINPSERKNLNFKL